MVSQYINIHENTYNIYFITFSFYERLHNHAMNRIVKIIVIVKINSNISNGKFMLKLFVNNASDDKK